MTELFHRRPQVLLPPLLQVLQQLRRQDLRLQLWREQLADNQRAAAYDPGGADGRPRGWTPLRGRLSAA
jgi:hypothetical protein